MDWDVSDLLKPLDFSESSACRGFFFPFSGLIPFMDEWKSFTEKKDLSWNSPPKERLNGGIPPLKIFYNPFFWYCYFIRLPFTHCGETFFVVQKTDRRLKNVQNPNVSIFWQKVVGSNPNVSIFWQKLWDSGPKVSIFWQEVTCWNSNVSIFWKKVMGSNLNVSIFWQKSCDSNPNVIIFWQKVVN